MQSIKHYISCHVILTSLVQLSSDSDLIQNACSVFGSTPCIGYWPTIYFHYFQVQNLPEPFYISMFSFRIDCIYFKSLVTVITWLCNWKEIVILSLFQLSWPQLTHFNMKLKSPVKKPCDSILTNLKTTKKKTIYKNLNKSIQWCCPIFSVIVSPFTWVIQILLFYMMCKTKFWPELDTPVSCTEPFNLYHPKSKFYVLRSFNWEQWHV